MPDAGQSLGGFGSWWHTTRSISITLAVSSRNG